MSSSTCGADGGGATAEAPAPRPAPSATLRAAACSVLEMLSARGEEGMDREEMVGEYVRSVAGLGDGRAESAAVQHPAESLQLEQQARPCVYDACTVLLGLGMTSHTQHAPPPGLGGGGSGSLRVVLVRAAPVVPPADEIPSLVPEKAWSRSSLHDLAPAVACVLMERSEAMRVQEVLSPLSFHPARRVYDVLEVLVGIGAGGARHLFTYVACGQSK
eukprot:TRINITY_DN6928_c0_g1_i1.p2 TRINITY_DN6928_c0_g1~~TRINITY_DN6928_c0_g1_i1.p2  ORF type:complete len:217 (-),score=49.59 TRINITY_DN6928_c0_g1_i1:173-823(-)